METEQEEKGEEGARKFNISVHDASMKKLFEALWGGLFTMPTKKDLKDSTTKKSKKLKS